MVKQPKWNYSIIIEILNNRKEIAVIVTLNKKKLGEEADLYRVYL